MNHDQQLPLVSLENMNIVHREELELLNTLLEQINSNADFETLSKSLEELLSHMQEHFASEEKLMQEAQYPSFRMHKGDHDKVLNEARYAEMEWRNRKDADALREYLEEELATWLDQHIKAMDTPMADFVSQFEKYKGF